MDKSWVTPEHGRFIWFSESLLKKLDAVERVICLYRAPLRLSTLNHGMARMDKSSRKTSFLLMNLWGNNARMIFNHLDHYSRVKKEWNIVLKKILIWQAMYVVLFTYYIIHWNTTLIIRFLVKHSQYWKVCYRLVKMLGKVSWCVLFKMQSLTSRKAASVSSTMFYSPVAIVTFPNSVLDKYWT